MWFLRVRVWVNFVLCDLGTSWSVDTLRTSRYRISSRIFCTRTGRTSTLKWCSCTGSYVLSCLTWFTSKAAEIYKNLILYNTTNFQRVIVVEMWTNYTFTNEQRNTCNLRVIKILMLDQLIKNILLFKTSMWLPYHLSIIEFTCE